MEEADDAIEMTSATNIMHGPRSDGLPLDAVGGRRDRGYCTKVARYLCTTLIVFSCMGVALSLSSSLSTRISDVEDTLKNLTASPREKRIASPSPPPPAPFPSFRPVWPDFLVHDLQSYYSILLYGGDFRCDLGEMRLIWIPLLRPHTVKLLNASCQETIDQPFYLAPDQYQAAALWVYQPDSPPLEDHQWVEVVHCPRAHSAETDGIAMWFFIAPGSGVSINLGRTHVLNPQKESKDTPGSEYKYFDEKGTDKNYYNNLRASYDTIQILHTGTERLSEVVLLTINDAGLGENAGIVSLGENQVRCGRPPYLRKCDVASSPAFQMISRCALRMEEAYLPNTANPLWPHTQAGFSHEARWSCNGQRHTGR